MSLAGDLSEIRTESRIAGSATSTGGGGNRARADEAPIIMTLFVSMFGPILVGLASLSMWLGHSTPFILGRSGSPCISSCSCVR